MLDNKSHFLYFEIEVSYSPTERDRIGYDGLYVKAVRQLKGRPSATTLDQASDICLKTHSSCEANLSSSHFARDTYGDYVAQE